MNNPDNLAPQVMHERFLFQQCGKSGGALTMIGETKQLAWRAALGFGRADLEVRKWDRHRQTCFIIRFLKSPHRFET